MPVEVLVRLRFFALHSLTEIFVPKIGWQVLEIISYSTYNDIDLSDLQHVETSQSTVAINIT